MGMENFFKKSNKIERKKFDMEVFIEGLQSKIKKEGSSINFEYLDGESVYLTIGNIIKAEKTNVVDGTEYSCLEFSTLNPLDENKELPVHEGKFIYVKDSKNPDGKIWLSKMVGTSHYENIGEDDIENPSLNNVKKIITDEINNLGGEKFLYRRG